MSNQVAETGLITERVDLLIQFCLAVAGDGDPGEQALGPIHLVKYVYLADLIHAERHQGQTYTGAPWRFHHYGPWSPEVWKRIEPAVTAVGALAITIPSTKHENDPIIYQAGPDLSLNELDRMLPSEIAVHLATLIRKYRSFTPELLHYVYGTKPMLKAAPEELLDFSFALAAERPVREEEAPISKAKLRRLQKAITAARGNKAVTKQRVRVEPATPPRYDDDFHQVARIIEDQECGLEACSGVVAFSDEVWKSKAREGAE
ncbi:MAG: hypothetical protein HY910_12070 [Desulfarculus sp.]|nr:hypothetical protein [Desulfarculus sp.]